MGISGDKDSDERYHICKNDEVKVSDDRRLETGKIEFA